jgi:hypothetical protein
VLVIGVEMENQQKPGHWCKTVAQALIFRTQFGGDIGETPLLFPLDLLGGALQARINKLPSSTIQKIGEADGRLAWVDRYKGKFIHYGVAQASLTR